MMEICNTMFPWTWYMLWQHPLLSLSGMFTSIAGYILVVTESSTVWSSVRQLHCIQDSNGLLCCSTRISIQWLNWTVKSVLLLVQSQTLVYLLTAHNGYWKHPISGVQIPATNQWLIHYQKECWQCGWLGIGFLFSNSHPFSHYRFQTYPAGLLPSEGKKTP